jgi:putative ABC transport system ATP-binding protein
MPHGTEPLIRVASVGKTYERGREVVHALSSVDLEIGRGEYLAIMGPSGSGKSTLFNMIGALDRPTSGTIRIDEVALDRLRSRELAYFRCRHVGYVFQSYNLIPALSALENVALPVTFLGVSDGAARCRASEMLAYVGLGDRLHHKPSELSGGQQQRVAIARALVNRPTILLADEPTANLDVVTAEHVIGIFRQLSEQGITVVSATHDHKMLQVSDRIVWMKAGLIDRIRRRSELEIRTASVGGEPA